MDKAFIVFFNFFYSMMGIPKSWEAGLVKTSDLTQDGDGENR